MKENYADSQLVHIIRIIVVYLTGIWTVKISVKKPESQIRTQG